MKQEYSYLRQIKYFYKGILLLRQSKESNCAIVRPLGSFNCSSLNLLCSLTHKGAVKAFSLLKSPAAFLISKRCRIYKREYEIHSVTHGHEVAQLRWSENEEVSQTNRLHMNDNEAQNW